MKKYLAALRVGMALLTAFATPVFAQMGSNPPPGTVQRTPLVVKIEPSGEVTLRGIVDMVNPNSITMHSWIGTWTVGTTASTTVSSYFRRPTAVSDIQAGDFIGVYGKMGAAGLSVDAQVVRNWTKRAGEDNDQDDIADTVDPDDDNDGIPDVKDAMPLDHDNDGINDAQDPDDDNDGIPDVRDQEPFTPNAPAATGTTPAAPGAIR